MADRKSTSRKSTSRKSTSRARSKSTSNNNAAPKGNRVYQLVTDRIIGLLKAGTCPWRRPWSPAAGNACNAVTGRRYRGMNAILLSDLATGYADPRWLTYKQAQEAGGNVRKGERSQLAVFWKMLERENRKGETERFPMARWYCLFNVAQCDGVDMDKLKNGPAPLPTFNPIEACERVALAQPHPQCPIDHGSAKACYKPLADRIKMPAPAAFITPAHYYATLFHELVHSTGHPSRLNRPEVQNVQPFGSPDYSREELVAEMGAAFICAATGIDCPDLDNNAAAYLASWIRVLEGDERLVMGAAAAAQRAADWLLRRDASADDDAGETAEPVAEPEPVGADA